MLELLIARHARAAGEPGVDDFARPLDARGEQDAPRMAARLHAAGLRPQRMLASPALRTMTTARALVAGLGFDPADIETDPAIYEATPGDLVAVLQARPADCRSCLLVGHNPGVTQLAHWLLGARSVPPLEPGTVLHLALDVGAWPALAPGCARLLARFTPEPLA